MITCSLAINGAKVADSATSLADGDTTALDGLAVEWGRTTRLDQPNPATCRARLALPAIDTAAALEQLRPGLPVEVTAVYQAGRTTSTVLSVPSETLTAGQPVRQVQRLYPPYTFAQHGSSPDSWDEIPRVTSRTELTVTITLAIPNFTTVTVRPAYFSGPWPTAYTPGPICLTATSSGTYTRTIVTPPDDTWVGLLVAFTPAGPSWQQMPGRWAAHSERWNHYSQCTVSNLHLERTDEPTYIATVFTGRISDIPVSYSHALHRPVATMTAVEFPAEMANVRIGAQPFPSESAEKRINRITQLTGLQIKTVIDERPASRHLAPLDIDNQDPWSVLTNIATSTGAIIWPATHATTGPYIRVEDLDKRQALYTLTIPPTGSITIDPAAQNAVIVPANSIHNNITIKRDTTDLATLIKISWKEVTRNDKGDLETHDQTEHTQDAARLAAYGYRSLSISTDLDTADQARDLAEKTLARTAPGGWQIPAATWDTTLPGSDPISVIAALDSTRRIGLPIMITGVATWVPGAPNIPVYLDGGSYTFSKGAWTLSLNLTRAATPANALTWRQTPAPVVWSRLNRLTWADLSAAQL